MPMPTIFKDSLELPVIAAPMFLVSGPELVIACAKAGVASSFPAPNTRSLEELEEWLERISSEVGTYKEENPTKKVAPWAMNLIVHPGNIRLNDELDLFEKYKVPFAITSVGNPKKAAERLNEIGAPVFHDVVTLKHARKAIEGGVDGLILVCAGAGGHTGSLNPFAFIAQVREFWDGPLAVGGSISKGEAIKAVEVLGADFAYMGSRFIATKESLADNEYKNTLIVATADDVIITNKFTGMNANYLRQSLERAGLDPKNFDNKDIAAQSIRNWIDVQSAGHGVGSIHDAPSVEELVATLKEEYSI